MTIETGYFFITDITGYTGFLTHSELDHAKEILDALFESILANIEAPLILSNTQGDAIICYAPADALHQPRQLLDVMEQTYFDFQHLLNLMKINNTCDCDACLNMSLLDLKIFLHYGEYLVQQIGNKSDLQGSDVILAHLLMKNGVQEKFKMRGYGLITDMALGAMGLSPAAENLQPHVEEHEHYGAVNVFIHDLRAAWKIERERTRLVVTAEDAIAHASVDLPIPPWITWDYLSSADFKLRFFDVESIERTDGGDGREGIGSSFHCRHRLGDINYLYVDYDPPNYVTFQSKAFGFTAISTQRVVATENGSRFEVYNGRPNEPYDEDDVRFQQKLAERSAATFVKVISEEIAAGRIDPNLSQAAASSREAFSRPAVADGRFGRLL
jgi:hypothetical protein